MEISDAINPRILIFESDRHTCAAVRRYVAKAWRGAAVQSSSGGLGSIVGNRDRLRSIDVIVAGCDFSGHGTTGHPVLRAVRAMAADPGNPPVILLTDSGSEFTAVESMKAGAFEYLPKSLLGREQLIGAVRRALAARHAMPSAEAVNGHVDLFGYDMRRRLSSRGNVSVHVAFSAEHGEEVVLKVLHRGRGALSRDADFERFVAEFKLLYDIDDPAVARIYDFRVTSQYSYIAMEYFPDGHLGRSLAAGPTEPAAALKTALEIAHALAIIHAAGVVHRDLKPANIMVRRNRTVALIDFGISQSSLASAAPAFDGSELISGTPYYMSPEQARGEPTDERTDLYALGVIFFQMLTGAKPFVGADTPAILAQHIEAPVPDLPHAHARFQPLLNRLLAKDPAQRLASAREAIETVEALRFAAPPRDYELSATSA